MQNCKKFSEMPKRIINSVIQFLTCDLTGMGQSCSSNPRLLAIMMLLWQKKNNNTKQKTHPKLSGHNNTMTRIEAIAGVTAVPVG